MIILTTDISGRSGCQVLWFSVIIPAYNCENSIERTVDSIVSSGLTDYEIVIINDGSTDNTASVCQRLCTKYSFVKYSEQENKGVSAARNRGISIATGEYILFFDADDTACENGFAECIDIAKNEEPDILVFGMRFDYYKNGKIYRNDVLVPEFSGCLDKNAIRAGLDSLYNTNSLASSCNKLYKRDLIINNKILFNTNCFLMEDFLFSLNCLSVCENIYCLPKALYFYKQSEDEKNAFNRLKRINDFCEYFYPFKLAIDNLNAGEIGNNVFNKFICMLISQKMYFSNKNEIEAFAENLKKNNLYSEIKQGEIPEIYKGLLKDIEKSRYLKIRLLHLKTQIRHKIAVAVKSVLRG